MAAATFLNKRNAVCERRFSSVSAWSLCSRTADLQGTFSPEARKTRPGGKAAGYDKSQRACKPSDTSRDFFDSLRRSALKGSAFCMEKRRPEYSDRRGGKEGTRFYCTAASKASRNSGQLQVPQADSLSFFTASCTVRPLSSWISSDCFALTVPLLS